MTKILNVIIVVLAVALILIIWYPQYQESRPVKLRIACDSTVTALPVLVGIEESTFVKNKIVPELVFFADPADAASALFAGDVDIAVLPWSVAFTHVVTKQETLRVFMAEDFRPALPIDGLVVKAGGRIRTVADLKGKRLAYPPQLRDYVPSMLRGIGFDTSKVRTVEAPLGDIPRQVAAGTVDVGWTLEPYLCRLDTTEFDTLAGVLGRVYSPFPGAAVGFSPKFLKTSSRALRTRLKIAADAAVALVETRPDDARAILADYFPAGDTAFCNEGCRGCRLPELQRLKEVDPVNITSLANRLVGDGVLADSVSARPMLVEPAQMTR